MMYTCRTYVLYLRVVVKCSVEGRIPLPTSSDEYLSVDELASLLVLKSIAKVARDGAVRCCWDISISDMALPNTIART